MTNKIVRVSDFCVVNVFRATTGAYLVALSRCDIDKAGSIDDAWQLYHVHGADTTNTEVTVHEILSNEIVATLRSGDELRIGFAEGEVIWAQMNQIDLDIVRPKEYRMKRRITAGKLQITITPRNLAVARH